MDHLSRPERATACPLLHESRRLTTHESTNLGIRQCDQTTFCPVTLHAYRRPASLATVAVTLASTVVAEQDTHNALIVRLLAFTRPPTQLLLPYLAHLGMYVLGHS